MLYNNVYLIVLREKNNENNFRLAMAINFDSNEIHPNGDGIPESPGVILKIFIVLPSNHRLYSRGVIWRSKFIPLEYIHSSK